jgi:hypothetical protein
MNRFIFDKNVKGLGGIGEYVDEEGGGKVGCVRCRFGVVALSIKILRRIPLFEDVEAADDDRERAGRFCPGRMGVGDNRGTPSSCFPPPSNSGSNSYSGVVAFPLTALACPCAVDPFGRFIAALAGASSN